MTSAPVLKHNRGELRQRQQELIENNLTWLRQGLALLGQIDDAAYIRSPQDLEPHRAGGHLRHIIEFYECFLAGLESGHVDYDARTRDKSIETSRFAAAGRIRSIISKLLTTPELYGDSIVWVRMEDSNGVSDPYMTSSIGRELQTLSSHTIHHFALIAMTLRSIGVAVDRDFGMAPSTLRYERGLEAA